MKDFLEFTKNLIGLVILMWILFTFILGISMVPNNDMSPRLKAGDIIFCYKIDKEMDARDIVLVKKNDTEYIGRVVARPGDTVDINDSGLVVNGHTVSEDDIFSVTKTYEGYVDYPVQLGTDECFILCDNREGARDSRYFGPVKQDEIIGTIIGSVRRGSV